jgi:hypothetical protein
MSGRQHRSGIGFGGAVGLGIAAALCIGILAVGHAIFRQLTGAAAVVVIFAAVVLCVLLTAAALAAVGLLAKHGQLARLEVAERRLTLEQHAREVYGPVRAEVLEGNQAEAPISQVPQPSRVAILGKRAGYLPGRRLEAVPADDDQGGAS